MYENKTELSKYACTLKNIKNYLGSKKNSTACKATDGNNMICT